MKFIKFVAMILIIVGALNWGLVGFFQYNLISDFVGPESSGWARIIYGLVGLAGLYSIVFLCKCCCGCHHGPSCGCGSCRKGQD
jgi:hypothetical protein